MMKKFLVLLAFFFGSSTFAGEVRIPEWRGYPPNNPTVCKTYLIRNDVYKIYYYREFGYLYREEVYWYSYYTRRFDAAIQEEFMKTKSNSTYSEERGC